MDTTPIIAQSIKRNFVFLILLAICSGLLSLLAVRILTDTTEIFSYGVGIVTIYGGTSFVLYIMIMLIMKKVFNNRFRYGSSENGHMMNSVYLTLLVMGLNVGIIIANYIFNENEGLSIYNAVVFLFKGETDIREFLPVSLGIALIISFYITLYLINRIYKATNISGNK